MLASTQPFARLLGDARIQRRMEEKPSFQPRHVVHANPKSCAEARDVHGDTTDAALLEAYAIYRKSVTDPWPLGCCGSGELENHLAGREGVENFGFRQPGEIIQIMRSHGAFVLASNFDPWPLVVVEACAAGLPVICTETCGSSVELVRSYHNGLTVATGDAGMLAGAMKWMHGHADRMPEMGRRGRELAAAYSAQMWATRWAETLREFQK